MAKAKKPGVRKKTLITLVSKDAWVSRSQTSFIQHLFPQTLLLGLNREKGSDVKTVYQICTLLLALE